MIKPMTKTEAKILEAFNRLHKACGEPISTSIVAHRAGVPPNRVVRFLNKQPTVAVIKGFDESGENYYLPAEKLAKDW